MTIHSTLTPLPDTAVPFDWPQLNELGSGGFASVRELGPTEVLKLTCCSASNTWLTQACARPASWPEAFPAVYQRLGELAVDNDDMVFTGWRMERLFALDDKKGAIAARSASIGKRMRKDPAAAARPVAPEHGALEALLSVCDLCDIDPEEHHSVDASAALLLASASEGPLREGFLALRTFILQNAVKLDVSNRSNVMMDCFGRLRLADPLTMRLDQSTRPAPYPRQWVAARLPQRQRGFEVSVHWTAAPFATAAAADTAAQKVKLPGVQVVLCDEAQAANLVSRKPEDVKVFAFGSALSELLGGEPAANLLAGACIR